MAEGVRSGNCFQFRNKNVLLLPFRNNIIYIDNYVEIYANCTVCRLILLGDACSGREMEIWDLEKSLSS